MATTKEYFIEYRKKHPERVREAQRKYYIKNKEKKLKAQKEYRDRKKDEIKNRQANKYKNKKEEITESINTYRRLNPCKVKVWRHNQNSKRSKAVGSEKLSTDIAEKAMLRQKGKCPVCGASLKRTGHHLDHIVPLARGGKNINSNVHLTCPKCNLEKGHKDPIAFMQSRGYLL